MRSITPWSKIAREERFFTCMLFYDLAQDLKQDREGLWMVLRRELGIANGVTVEDVGFEVCFFRDAAHAKLIERQSAALEKLTFDLVLWLSSQSVVIFEAKAQQGFGVEQLEMLHYARKAMRSSATWPINQIYLVGLCSSNIHSATDNHRQL